MQKRRPGNSNLEVWALGLGCMGMSFSYGPPADKQEMLKIHRLEENIGATAIELSAENLHELESAAAKLPVQDARYPEHIEKMTGL